MPAEEWQPMQLSVAKTCAPSALGKLSGPLGGHATLLGSSSRWQAACTPVWKYVSIVMLVRYTGVGLPPGLFSIAPGKPAVHGVGLAVGSVGCCVSIS